ncbi:MAG TPA: hypothetical protein VN813_15515 [Luteibacter sp.]|nr:hypothetical protein [Luteibacter sp.]
MRTMDSARLRRFCLAQALACALPLTALAATPQAASSVPTRFDEAVAAALPATLATSVPADGPMKAGMHDTDDLVVRRRIDSQSTYSDGTLVDLYDVQYRGHDALAIRHGANLRIVRIEDKRLRTTAFAPGAMPIEKSQPIDSPPPLHAIDEAPAQDATDGLPDDEESKDLHVFAFIHDDVPFNDDEIFDRHFGWWIKRMQTDVLEDRSTHVHLRRNIPGITDPSYGYRGALSKWMGNALDYVDPILPAPVGIKYIRNILLVKGAEAEPGAAGVSHRQPGSFAMASTKGSIAVPAHELGHLLGASHDHAERRFAGPFSTCDTIMYPVDPTAVCKTYSLPNIELIRGTMKYKKPR